MKTIGRNIARLRKEKNITQEKLAEICSVSPQAVSKWENDLSCPDITLLKLIARTLGVSVDELLDDGEGPVTSLLKEGECKGKLLKVRVSDGGDKINVNIPVALVEILLKNEQLKEKISFGGNSKVFESIDFRQIMDMISLGVMGKLVEIESSDGGIVEVWVE